MYIDIHTHDDHKVAIVLKGQSSRRVTFYCEAVHPIEVPHRDVVSVDDNIIAIGETGLDYRKEYRAFAPEQRLVFARYIELANATLRPLIIHQVRALDDTLELLKSAQVPVIFHGFSGSFESAQRIIRAGYNISIGHLLLNNKKLAKVLTQIPTDRFFLESDQSNVPIEQIYEKAASILSVDVAELEIQIEKNYERIFMARENRVVTRS